MIYNINNISLFLNNLHRSRTEDNRPYIFRKHRIQAYSKQVREQLQFRQELKIKENLRIEQELQEFRERWLDDIRRINEMFEAGEDDSLFPTKQGCKPVSERGIFEVEDNSLFPTGQYPESGKNHSVDTSQPLWGLDYLLRNGENREGKKTNGK